MAHSEKAATFRGKLIVTTGENPKFIKFGDEFVDHIISENLLFSVYKQAAEVGPSISTIKFDDGSPITLADTISVDVVPDDAEASFVLEPAYIYAQ